MSKIGLFYAPAGGSVERVGQLIANKIGSDKVDMVLVESESEATIFDDYDKLIFGISTVGRDNWDAFYKKIGWDSVIPQISSGLFEGKTIALYGLGNHLLYPENFVDALGTLGEKVLEGGGKIVGYTSIDGYDFSDSAAIVDSNYFYGLAIDEDNEPELTEIRTSSWVDEIKAGFLI